MNHAENLKQMEELRMFGMQKCYQSIVELPIHKQPEGEELLPMLLQAEILSRQNGRMTKLLKESALRYQPSIEQIICSAASNFTKTQLLKLADCSFIERAENALITGPTGGGKTYLACAIGHQACLKGNRTIYLNMNRFIEKIALAKIEGTFVKMLNHFDKFKLVILDDFGLRAMDHDTKIALLQILEDRYQKKSTIIVSQLPVANWYNYISEPTMADAIMDRISAHAHRIDLKGDSLRQKTTANN